MSLDDFLRSVKAAGGTVVASGRVPRHVPGTLLDYHPHMGATRPGYPEPICYFCGLVRSSAIHAAPPAVMHVDGAEWPEDDDQEQEENPREKGDDDGQEYGDPRDYRDGRE